jgi:ADP-ribose pyrophosphatase YjhB (NUDIX family)
MIAPARYCMACGERLRTVRVEDRRRRRCPRCAWTFYDNPVPAAVAIVGRRGRILLARRGGAPYRGSWDLPGGFLEADEAPEAGLRRELSEELGAATTALRWFGIFPDRYGPGGFPILAIVYVVRLAGELRVGSDVSEARWFSTAAIPWSEIRFASVRRALQRYLEGRR